jgi:hypothetical protein
MRRREGKRRKNCSRRRKAGQSCKKRCLGTYRRSVFTVDLKDLTRQWNEADKAFFLFKYFRKSKVRRQLQPHTDGKVPSDIRNDDLLAQIKALANGADEKSTEETVREILDERFANNILHPPPVASSQSLRAAWGQVELLLPKMQQLTGHPFLLTGTHWLDDVLEVISRWKANIGRANTWMNWKSVSSQAGIIGLVSVVDAVENQSLNGSEIQQASEVSYDRWWIDRVVTEDAVLRSFIAEQHEEMMKHLRSLSGKLLGRLPAGARR